MDAKTRTVNFFKEEDGTEPFREWLKSLKRKNKNTEHAKILTRIDRAGAGNLGDHRFLGGNWGELKIDVGPGYRVYFGIDGDEVVLLLHGGTKEDQQHDINLAAGRWKQYLEGKKENSDGK